MERVKGKERERERVRERGGGEREEAEGKEDENKEYLTLICTPLSQTLPVYTPKLGSSRALL